jgi:hypothetical protein
MNYYVFQVSDQSNYGKQKSAFEVFDFLVRERSVWGFGFHTPNRKAILPGDRILFYLTGSKNQTFVGSATLKTGAYKDEIGESKDWYLDPETLRIDLEDIKIFNEPKPRSLFKSIEWKPAQGGSSKISERDYQIITGVQQDTLASIIEPNEEMEFVLEKYLEEFIVDNWDKIDFGEILYIYKDKDGNIGKQYYTEDVGYIDILAQDGNKNFVIMELKKGRKNDEVIGQVLRYMGWVRENLAKKNEDVKGYIIVGEKDKKLEYALKEISNKVQVKLYNISFRLNDYKY